MAAERKDPTESIPQRASEFPDVAEGTSCTQGSFKVGEQAFRYIGPRGRRWKAMFKLDASRAQAEALAEERPDDFQAGSTAWVTARFRACGEKPGQDSASWSSQPCAARRHALRREGERHDN